ncbi:hypothetical protein KC19_VG196200 [Ceratodon purpureus]|uniref:Uncharacterized protein n=1 Tax=Ceratodon purpureus TaxID=3225 RepID=A0A8T0HRQ1_CERPU|nr:hypothetical protein KC19_VG196200 [Ceratodon purpureus]
MRSRVLVHGTRESSEEVGVGLGSLMASSQHSKVRIRLLPSSVSPTGLLRNSWICRSNIVSRGFGADSGFREVAALAGCRELRSIEDGRLSCGRGGGVASRTTSAAGDKCGRTSPEDSSCMLPKLSSSCSPIVFDFCGG